MISKKSLYSLLFTIFNDALGWGIVLTLFAPLLFSPEGGLLPRDASLDSQNIILGFLIGCYPLTQFFFMPFIGALSDHLGRKRVLLGTILCAGLSFALSAVAVFIGSLALLFLSRILAGIFSANSATALAAIADISPEKEKAKNFSLSSIAGGLSWVIGPPLGGLLSSKALFPWASFATPLFIVSGLFFINYFWVKRSFEETYVKSTQAKHDWKQELKDLFKLTKIPHMSAWLTISFFFYFGWGFYILFYPALLVQEFHFDQASIGLLSGYFSLFWLATSLVLNRGLAMRAQPKAFILFGLPLAGLLILILSFVSSIFWWIVLFPFVSIAGTFIWINLSALLSNLAGRENQGKVFGIGQSILSLAMFISPMLSGPLAALQSHIPLSASGLILLSVGASATFYHFQRARFKK